jgi:hypothetical protein
MDKPSRARLRLLALFLPLTAVLYIAAEALDPKGTDQLISTTAVAFGVLPIAARHPAQLMLPFAAAMVLLAARIWQAATRPARAVTGPEWRLTTSPSPGRKGSRAR